MKALKSKLKNSRGVSIIIALVFMLFCLFVGGTVLTAATVNSYRIKRVPKQQEFLDQRSAAMLIADDLVAEEKVPVRVMIQEYSKQEQGVDILPSGEVIPKAGTIVRVPDIVIIDINLPVDKELTPLQRTVYETGIWKYVKDNGIASTAVTIHLKKNNTLFKEIKMNQLWLQPAAEGPVEGTITLSDKNGILPAEGISANFHCDNKDRHFDYVVDFGTFSQLEVRMEASVGKNLNPSVEEVIDFNNGTGKKVTTDTKMTVISWSDPMIAKAEG